MTRIRKWALAVCSALLLTNYSATINAQPNSNLDPTQVYTTGNLTTWSSGGSATTGAWQNVGQWGGSLTCWGPGGPGYCGPQPYVNSNGYGNINFSYGLTDLYQIVNIANALPHSGTGLRVNGFNFGFQAKNGNGWDNGQQDYLVAYVNFYDSKGTLSQNYNYGAYTNHQYNWNYFSFSETFANPIDVKNLSTARYGFVGGDTNGWAGPYGPEVNSVSFRLKYTVDPCYVNKLSSPTCPGYQEEMAKLNPPVSTTIIQANTVTVTPTPVATAMEPAAPITGPSSSGTTVAGSSSSTTGATPTATNPQPRVGEVTITGSPAKTVPSAAQLLAIVRKEQSRVAEIEQTTVTAAVSQAQSQAQPVQEQSMTISAAAVATSQASSQSVTSTMPVSVASTPSLSATANIAQGIRYNQTVAAMMLKPEFENSSSEGLKLTSTGPMGNFVNPQPAQSQTLPDTPPGPAVNSRALDNEAAGGVSIAAMARTPQGFESYMSMLPDARFYDPREIYRGQRVVDNARVQRALSGASDRLHQQMVDQQYKK